MVSYVCRFWPPGQGARDQTYLHPSTSLAPCGSKIAAAHELFAFSLHSSLNDHYTERKWQSNIAHHQWYTLQDLEYIWVTTTVVLFMRCSFRTCFKGAGWSTAMYIVQIALACWDSEHRVSCMVLEQQLNIVYAAVLGCSHLLLIVVTASARAMLS